MPFPGSVEGQGHWPWPPFLARKEGWAQRSEARGLGSPGAPFKAGTGPTRQTGRLWRPDRFASGSFVGPCAAGLLRSGRAAVGGPMALRSAASARPGAQKSIGNWLAQAPSSIHSSGWHLQASPAGLQAYNLKNGLLVALPGPSNSLRVRLVNPGLIAQVKQGGDHYWWRRAEGQLGWPSVRQANNGSTTAPELLTRRPQAWRRRPVDGPPPPSRCTTHHPVHPVHHSGTPSLYTLPGTPRRPVHRAHARCYPWAGRVPAHGALGSVLEKGLGPRSWASLGAQDCLASSRRTPGLLGKPRRE